MKSALINCFYINSKEKSADKADVNNLPELKNEGDFIWIQLDFTIPEANQILQLQNLGEQTIQALTKEESRPRVEINNEELLLIVRGVNLIKGEKPENMISVRILATKNLLITCQRKSLTSLKDIITEIEQGNAPKSPGDFIIRLNERLVINMSEVMEDIEDSAIEMEELVMDDDESDYKQDLHNLRLQIIQLKRYLIPQRDALNKLQLERTTWITSKQQSRLREVSDYLMRYIELLDAARELTAVSQETLDHRQNEQINKRMYLLSIIAALFLPLSFFTGLLGVNLAGIPYAGTPYAFAGFIIILIIVVGFQFLFFRKNKWL